MKLLTSRRPGVPTGKPLLPRGAERGFALPMTILVIAFLTVTIAAAYSATSAEIMTNAAQRGESRAYMIAQAGLESFMARRNESNFCPTVPRPGQTTAPCGFPPKVTVESTTVTLPGGYAEITAQRIRVGTDTRPAIYLLRSRGVDTTLLSVVSSSSSAIHGERTVAQLVYWNVNQVQVISGWTSASGLDVNGSSGFISGDDNNMGGGNCPPHQSSVAGIAVPTGDYSSNGNFAPVGSPPVQMLGTQAEANASIKIDWNGIVNGDRIQPDFDFMNGATANAAWPDMSSPSYYPVIRVEGNLDLDKTRTGHGTLIVTGNLTLNGTAQWTGLILVGGKMTSNGDNTMLGATVSGLNAKLSQAQIDSANTAFGTALNNTPTGAVANGKKTFQYDSCEVAKAAAGVASYSVYPNAWMDNFVTY